MLTTIRRLLASPRAPLIAALIAVLLYVPTIGSGLFMDDLTHRVTFNPQFLAPGGPRGDWDIFRFQGPDRAYLHRNLDLGLWPWWVAPSFRLAFFRPLSSLSHALDYKVWPNAAWLMHIENIALYAAMALFVGLFYRRHLKPAWAAGLAALFFAIDDAHSMTVSWIANRNALFACAFGFAALLAYDHGRRGSRRAAILGPILFALGLLSGEAALGPAAYIASYAAILDDAPIASRVKSLVPYGALGVVWLGIYKVLGYGAFGGGMYIDPATEPFAFARALAERLPLLLAGQLAIPPTDLWGTFPKDQYSKIALGLALPLLALAAVFYRTLKEDRSARFFCVGMLLSLFPVCATWPSDRLLLSAGLGGFGLIAVFIGRAWAIEGGAERRIATIAAVFFIVIHGVIAPLLLPLRSMILTSSFGTYIARAEASLPSDPALAGQTLVVLNAPDIFTPTYPVADRIYRGIVIPKRVRHLAIVAQGQAEVTRVDAHTISITQSNGFLHDIWSPIYRGPGVPFQVGEEVAMIGMTAKVAEILPDGRARRVVFRFDDPLDSESLRWVTWEGVGFVAAAPPAAGETKILPAIDFTKAITGSK